MAGAERGIMINIVSTGSTREEKQRVIAEIHGYHEQSDQLIEEMGELTQAINKMRRAEKYGTPEERKKRRKELIKEYADVENMLRLRG